MKFPEVCIAEGLRIKNEDLQHKKTGSLSEPPLNRVPFKKPVFIDLKIYSKPEAPGIAHNNNLLRRHWYAPATINHYFC